jgi:hypothetical protein
VQRFMWELAPIPRITMPQCGHCQCVCAPVDRGAPRPSGVAVRDGHVAMIVGKQKSRAIYGRLVWLGRTLSPANIVGAQRLSALALFRQVRGPLLITAAPAKVREIKVS